MRYAVTYTAPELDYCRIEAETPVRAVHIALDLKGQGFEVRVTDCETGIEYRVGDFAKAHDLAVVEDAIPLRRMATSPRQSVH